MLNYNGRGMQRLAYLLVTWLGKATDSGSTVARANRTWRHIERYTRGADRGAILELLPIQGQD